MDSNFDGASKRGANDSRGSDFDRIAEVSLTFEEKWTPGRAFSIENALALAPERESARRDLFKLLLEIDLTRGFETKSAKPIEEYVRRFPDWKQIVESSARKISQDFQNSPYARIGKKVGSYSIDEFLGQGGTGCVYKAFDSRFQRTVAVKFLNNVDEQNEEQLRFFGREIVAMGQISSSLGFVQAYDCGLDDGTPYLVMEYVDGIDLQRYFKNADGRRESAGPLNWREATDYVAQIAAGLIAIHNLGLVHRDVKPANVMLNSEGKIRVLDLGFADFSEASDGRSADSKEKIIAGTRAFLAPEARYGQQALDARSDLYCLGGTFLYLLTGLVPSDRFDPFSNESPVPIRDFLRGKDVELPDAVVDVLERLLQPDREKRYPTAQDAWNDLNALIAPKRSLFKKIIFTELVVLSALVFVLIGEGLYVHFGMNDRAKFIRAVDAYKQDDLDRSFALLQRVRPQKLPISDQARYFMLFTRGCIKAGKYPEAQDSIKSALNTLKRLPVSSDALIQELYARALEMQALVLLGETSIKENPEKGTSFLNEMENKFSEFSERRDASDATIIDATIYADADVFYWRARCYYALNENNVGIAKADLLECLERNSDFPDARRMYGDLLCEEARDADADDDADADEFRQSRAREAVEQYKSASRNPFARGKKYALLRKTILLCEFLGDRESELEACEQLLSVDFISSVARRYRGRCALFESLATSTDDAASSKKDEILSDLRAVASDQNYWDGATREDRWTRLTKDAASSIEQKKGEIWIEIALAEWKLGLFRNYDACLDAVEEALKTNGSQSVYVIGGKTFNAYTIQREALEKKLEFCADDDERRKLEAKIEEVARKETESKAEEESQIVDKLGRSDQNDSAPSVD